MHDVVFLAHRSDDREERIEEDETIRVLQTLVPNLQIVTHPDDALGAVVFGRMNTKVLMHCDFAWPTLEDVDPPYWTDPAFLAHANRSVRVGDLDQAIAMVEEIHASGRDAFVKSTRSKHLVLHVPRGIGLFDALVRHHEIAYSFIDVPNCLIVQEHVSMTHEYRMFVVDGELVAGAGVVVHHTPLDNEALFDPKMSPTPKGEIVESRPDLLDAYLDLAREIVPRCRTRNMTLDLATIDGRVGIVEINHYIPGSCGLYAADVEVLTRASLARAYGALEGKGVVARRRPAPDRGRPVDLSRLIFADADPEDEEWTDENAPTAEEPRSVPEMRRRYLGF